MELAGKRVLVTGGAVRIGRAICEALARQGCTVLVHYSTSEAEAERLVDALRRGGATAFSVKADLGDETSCASLIQAAVSAAGGLDILVNNAAVFHRDSLEMTTEAKLRAEIETNAFAPIYLTRAFAALSGDTPSGCLRGKVINLLDQRVAGLECGTLPYLLSKKMLAEFTKIAALELAPEFTVNAVAPGPVLPPPGEGPERTRELAGSTPLGMPLTPQAVAQAVVYLLAADAVTGQTIFVDGGQHLG
jgi:pteridine reductase